MQGIAGRPRSPSRALPGDAGALGRVSRHRGRFLPVSVGAAPRVPLDLPACYSRGAIEPRPRGATRFKVRPRWCGVLENRCGNQYDAVPPIGRPGLGHLSDDLNLSTALDTLYR